MFTTEQLENLAQKLCSSLPAAVANLDVEIKEKFKEILSYTFSKLDLVTREEFDVQLKVLARTREKVETLENELLKIYNAQKTD